LDWSGSEQGEDLAADVGDVHLDAMDYLGADSAAVIAGRR
jgi:hypothetical protein